MRYWLFPLPPLPRRHRLRIDPQAFPRLLRFVSQHFQHRIPQRILPIPPAPAFLYELLIEIQAIGQDHDSKDAFVLVVTVGLDSDLLAERQLRSGVLRSCAERLALLRAGDHAETNALCVIVVQAFESVAVEDVNNLANTGAPDNAGNVQYCGAWEGLSRRSRREQ